MCNKKARRFSCTADAVSCENRQTDREAWPRWSVRVHLARGIPDLPDVVGADWWNWRASVDLLHEGVDTLAVGLVLFRGIEVGDESIKGGIHFDRASQPVRFIIVWKYKSENGQPIAADHQRMILVEDALESALEEDHFATLALVATGEGLRERTYYAKSDDEFMARLNWRFIENRVNELNRLITNTYNLITLPTEMKT